jgi:beta-lactamase regulating signal transducer with metallopeptidase domain
MTPAVIDAAAMVLSWLATYAIHSTILLAVAALVAWRLADRHEWLDLIWKTAVLAPLVTASLHVDALAVPVAGRWVIASVTTATPIPAAAPTPDAVQSAPVAAPAAAQVTAPERVQTTHSAGSSAVGHRSAAAPRVASWPATVSRTWPAFAVGLWLLVAIAGVTRYAVRLRRVYGSYRSGLPVTSADLANTIDGLRLAAKERRAIRLTTTARCPVPLALGGGHVVVPERFMRELDAEQQRAALAHEVAHVVRRDPEWRIGMQMIERVLFFQPLNRLARARLCDSAEFLCDEWAVRQTQSPLALARCLSVVASWWSSAGTLPAGASAMARSDSAMVRRVTRILNEPAPLSRGPRLPWLLIPVALVAVAAPRVTATALPMPASVRPDAAAEMTSTRADKIAEQSAPPRASTPAEIAAARAQIRDYRSTPSGGSLEDRWRQAVADAGKAGLSDFWIVYTFTTPTHAGDTMLADSHEGSFVSSTDASRPGACRWHRC